MCHFQGALFSTHASKKVLCKTCSSLGGAECRGNTDFVLISLLVVQDGIGLLMLAVPCLKSA